MMEALLEKERELQRLNAELDEKQKKLVASGGSGGSPAQRSKLVSSRGRAARLRGHSRPASRSRRKKK